VSSIFRFSIALKTLALERQLGRNCTAPQRGGAGLLWRFAYWSSLFFAGIKELLGRHGRAFYFTRPGLPAPLPTGERALPSGTLRQLVTIFLNFRRSNDPRWEEERRILPFSLSRHQSRDWHGGAVKRTRAGLSCGWFGSLQGKRTRWSSNGYGILCIRTKKTACHCGEARKNCVCYLFRKNAHFGRGTGVLACVIKPNHSNCRRMNS